MVVRSIVNLASRANSSKKNFHGCSDHPDSRATECMLRMRLFHRKSWRTYKPDQVRPGRTILGASLVWDHVVYCATPRGLESQHEHIFIFEKLTQRNT